jgi:hypothetical protein
MMALEVIWFPLLMYGSTALAISLMLAVVLAAIALGGLAAGLAASPRRAADVAVGRRCRLHGRRICCSICARFALPQWADPVDAVVLTFPMPLLSGSVHD